MRFGSFPTRDEAGQRCTLEWLGNAKRILSGIENIVN